MPDWGKNHRLALIAGTCFIAGMLLVGIPVDASSVLRSFFAGVLIGAATLVIALRWTWFK